MNKQNLAILWQTGKHRVDRVPRFFSSRWNWDSPIPSPAGEFVPPSTLWFRGDGHISLRERGGGSQFQRGDIHCGTPGILYTLSGKPSLERFVALWYWPLNMTTFEHEHALYCATLTLLSYCRVRWLGIFSLEAIVLSKFYHSNYNFIVFEPFFA